MIKLDKLIIQLYIKSWEVILVINWVITQICVCLPLIMNWKVFIILVFFFL